MQNRFIINHDNQEQGPFSESEILDLLKTGEVLPIDYYYDEDLQDWVMIQDRFSHQRTDTTALTTPLAAPPDVLSAMLPYPSSGDLPPPQPVGPKKNVRMVLIESEPEQLVVKDPAPAFGTEQEPIPRAIVSAPSPAPVAASTAPQSAASKEVSPRKEKSARVEFKGGVGVISLKQLQAGRVQIRLEDPHASSLQQKQEAVIDIEPGPAKTITWSASGNWVAGEAVTIELVSRDAYDNLTPAFNGTLYVVIRGQKQARETARFENGKCQVKLHWTVAEALHLEVVAEGNSNLALPAPLDVKVKAGPAHQIVIESQSKAQAGENIEVTVKALDQYGNIADYNGDLNLAVVNSAPPKAS